MSLHSTAAKRRAGRVVGGKGTYKLPDDERRDVVDYEVFAAADPFNGSANGEVYDPGPKQIIPKSGAWITIRRRLPAIEGGIDEHVRVARIFWGEHENGADDEGFIPGGQYRICLTTPWGDVKLWPYEYARVDVADVLAMWQRGELTFHPTNVSEAQFNATVFYVRSRGIALPDAMVMALGSIAGPVGWFEPHPDLAEIAEAMERSAHAPFSEHKRRRAEARRRRDAPENPD